ncbi:hypothetical protein HHI36_020062 [Cryptolaemus montrouzieri]|uniref:Uncharacterized protein n=1 Tax=Cryptolaemus montrouzieri TaxID=559131 RepID=A0ABD2N934_9CUCU
MRQDALMKRRKAVEDLLQIHQKLLEEEKKIEELEMAANAVIMQIPISNQTKPSNTTKMKVKGTQLNELVQKMGVIAEKKFLDNKIYCLSQSSYNRLNREAGNYLSKHKKSLLGSSSTIETSQSKDPLINDISIQTNKTDELKEGNNQKSRNSSDIISVSKEKSPQYSEDFELDTQNIEDVIIPDEDESNLSSISELIEDFSKIEHGISMLSKQFVTRPSSAESYKSSISSENISESLNQSSVIETNKISPRTTIDNSSMVKDKSVMHTEEYNSLKGEMSTTLETIKDEDISAMIHEMIPSSTTTSLISSELEKNNESNNEISKEIKETGEISNIEVNDVSEGFIPEKLSEDLDEVISEKLIVSNISKRATSEKEGIDISSVSQEIISENNPDTLERVSLKELSEEEVMTDISEKVILEREDITKNYVLTEVIPEKDKFHSEEDNIEISENLPEEVDKTSIMEELSSEKNLDEVVAASNSEPVGIQLEELEHSLQTNTESASKDRFEDDLNSFTRDTGSVVDLQNEYSLTNHSETISTENNSKLNSFNATPIIEMTESIVPSEKHENVEEVQDNITKSENKPDQESETYSKFELENYLPDNISYVDTEAVEKSTSLDSEVSSESRALDQISLESALNKFDSNHTDKIITNNEIQLAEVLPESANDTYNSNKVSQEENYDNVEEIYQFDKKPEVSKTDSTEGNSTDISEKLSTDSEPVETPEQPHSGSSEDNYSDDFEDDKEENSHDTEKYVSKDSVPSSIANDVLMVRIDLPSESLINEAKIVVMNEERRENFDSIIEEQNDEDRKIGGLEEATDKQVIESQIETNETLEVDIPKTQGVNVMKRVSEILANTVDAPKNSKDKSVRYQDYYVTTYEDITPTNSPESVSSVKSPNVPSVNIFGNEAEELLKKQLAIEQEIKHLEQQQKEQMPFMYMREIPNKPPPPYTPPSTITSNAITILPAKVEDLNEICNYSAKVLYNAYLSNNLNSVTFSETHFKSINQTKSTKECCLFVFDLCRQVANEHYKRFEKENVPYWMKLPENSRLILGRPFDYQQLEKHINTKVKELLGFEKPEIKETSIIKWSRKKKDHVDEILILECLAQEHQWLNFDKEELIVKDKVTNEILNMLLNDTVAVFKKIFP